MPFNKKCKYQKDFARYVNHKAIFKSIKWQDYNKKELKAGCKPINMTAFLTIINTEEISTEHCPCENTDYEDKIHDKDKSDEAKDDNERPVPQCLNTEPAMENLY